MRAYNKFAYLVREYYNTSEILRNVANLDQKSGEKVSEFFLFFPSIQEQLNLIKHEHLYK